MLSNVKIFFLTPHCFHLCAPTQKQSFLNYLAIYVIFTSIFSNNKIIALSMDFLL